MIEPLLLIVLGMLIFASYLDLKYKAVPSVILTGLIFVVLILRPDHLFFGIASLVFGFVIKDLISNVAGMEFGIADVKILAVIGLLIGSLQNLFLMIILFVVFQFVYTAVWRWKVNKDQEMPFIPCLLAVYIALMLIGGVA